jgi:hypothetical protein
MLRRGGDDSALQHCVSDTLASCIPADALLARLHCLQETLLPTVVILTHSPDRSRHRQGVVIRSDNLHVPIV